MDGTATEASPSSNGATPLRRSVRRKLVQSTLFPLKPPEPKEKDEEEDEHDQDYDDAKNHKKRKPKAKTTPRKRGSASKNAKAKENSPADGIKGSTSPQILADSDQVDTPMPNLQLEAKLAAEENSRMFAGRPIHPFFLSRKAGKKAQDLSESASNLCTAKSQDEQTTHRPIHVFENIQNDTVSLDWRNWTLLENTTFVNYDPESSTSSVMQGSVESLNFDKLLGTLDPYVASTSQNALSSDKFSTHPVNLQVLPSYIASVAEQTICSPICKDAEVDLVVDDSVTCTTIMQAGIFRKSDTEPLSRFLQESMKSYYKSCENKAEGSLWTNKYKPTKAIEVCGNDASVSFLRDWLHLWHERRYKSRNDVSNRDEKGVKDVVDDDDYVCSLSGYDSEDMDKDNTLQNVLLITGPIGSGKSAAVYACAQEQGFDILELNASDCRNGTVVKQYFGDTLGSHGFKRLSKRTACSQKKTTSLALLSGKASDEVNDEVVEPITISDDEVHSSGGSSCKLLGKKDVVACDKVQTLILIEDVDILFPEDRGCIAAIQQIAETARGPIILTSNSDNPGLPENFDMVHVSFTLPSPKELLYHLYTVCLTEGVNIHPLLLEKFIQSCNGDIRKSIMHLQFWFQSKIFQKDERLETGYGSLPFDLDLGHQILPNMMPWDFPSDLSKLIENEIANSTNIMEENSGELVTEDLFHINQRHNNLDVECRETDYIKAKKVEMIKRNGSIADYSELEIQYNVISEFLNASGSPLASSQQNARRKLVVMSSDSEDDDSDHEYSVANETNKRQSIKENNECTSEFYMNGNCPSSSVRKLVCAELEDSEEEHFKSSETADDTCLNEICKSFDISCVPESTIVPETAIENGTEIMSDAVSSGHLVGPTEVSVNNEFKPVTFSARKRLVKLSQNPDLFVDVEFPNSSPKGVLQGVQDENIGSTFVNVMDECSRVDFKPRLTQAQSNPSRETDMIQKLWTELRERRMDLGQHATSEELDAFQVVKLTSGLSNLISEADLFHNHQQQRDIMEPPMFLCGEEATSSLYHEQIMMPTVAEHGFCYYAKRIADVGLKLGCVNWVDLTSKMLASTTNIMALGKLSRQDPAKCKVICTGNEFEWSNPINYMQKSETKTSLFEVIQSIVPTRISLAIKGDVFNEYLSSLRQISRSETLRIAQDVEKKRRGRVRGSHHYLSRCTMLSPEDISLVSEGDLYRKISTQHRADIEGKS